MFLRKYGTGTGAAVRIPIIKRGVVDFAVSADWAPAAGDVKISKDGGGAANIATLPTAVTMGNGAYWEFTFADAELQAKQIVVIVADSATKAVEDQCFIIETYGNASAMFQSDLSAAQLTANVTHFGGSAGTFSSGRPEVNTTHVAGTSQTAKDLGASVTQTGDSYARLGAPSGASVSADLLSLLNRLTSTRAGLLDNLDVAISVIQSQVTALNNLSAKCNWFGSLLLEIPDSGTRAYVFELVVKDDEDKLADLDASPTIALVNSVGTDRSSLITTTIANPSTGRYTLTITVGTSTTTEALKLTATGTVSGETRYAVLMAQVVDYDSATMINSIYTRIGAPAGASLAADIADLPTVAEFEARSIAAASYATASALSSLAARVPTTLVDGRMDCSVGAMASAVLTAAAIASGAFNGKGDWRTSLTLKGSLTETQVLNLIMAALAGETSQPSGTTEKFKHLDGTDAFTTTFDSNGNRTDVTIA